MNASVEKVQEWLDTYENVISISSSSTASTLPLWSYVEGNDGYHIAAADSFSAAAAPVITIYSNSSSSDDIQTTVRKIDTIWNRTDAMLNQQTFDVAVDEACLRYTSAEVVRILDLSDDEYYVPSSGLVNHILRWVFIAFTERFGKMQWRLDMIEKVRNTIASQYIHTCPVSDSDC